MKRITPKLAVLSLLVAAIVVGPMQTLAQEKKEKKPAAENNDAPKANRAIPFHGKISAIDKKAKTLSVGDRVFQVSSETKIKKAGKDATLDDASVGEDVGGSYLKGDDGKLTAKSLRIGPKPEGEAKGEGKKEKKEK